MSYNILFADDDLFYRQMMGARLGSLGHEIKLVSTAKEAIAAINENRFDLCIIDYHLPPGTASLAVLNEIHCNHKSIPVIMITGDNSLKAERHIRALGVDYLFVKPFDLLDLDYVINRLITLSPEISVE